MLWEVTSLALSSIHYPNNLRHIHMVFNLTKSFQVSIIYIYIYEDKCVFFIIMSVNFSGYIVFCLSHFYTITYYLNYSDLINRKLFQN
jgi:hypothetical protein